MCTLSVTRGSLVTRLYMEQVNYLKESHMATVQQHIAKGATAFSHVLKGAIQRRATQDVERESTVVLPQASRPAYITPGIAPELAAPALIARSPEMAAVKQPVPFRTIPAVTSPLTDVDAVVQTARSRALLDAYAREIESYPDIPLF